MSRKADSKTNSIQAKQQKQIAAIQQLLDSGLSFALFRKPFAEEVELILQTEGEATPTSQLTGPLKGFIYAPFCETKHRPTLLIRPDIVAQGWANIEAVTLPLQKAKRLKLAQLEHTKSDYLAASKSYLYKCNFDRIIRQIANGRFEKLVLSYCKETFDSLLNYEAEIFLMGLEAYPNAMVYLTYTPIAGRWMGCTPELLVERRDKEWKTMALAGTHVIGESEWDTKNVHEQDVVRRYIDQSLTELGACYTRSSYETMQIGQLMHRQNNYTFTLPSDTATLDVVNRLHPTPAVCGFPKNEAFRFLVKNEQSIRNYFSGYLGTIDGDHEASLYVNLRCAQICRNATYYHAGGGINLLSIREEEELEVERKINMLASLLEKVKRSGRDKS